MNISLHITWSTGVDFPLWRAQLKRNRHLFSQVIVSLSNNHEPEDISNWLRSELQSLDVIVIDPPELRSDDDWRDRAVNKAYPYITGDWIFFTEPDFFVKDVFLDKIFRATDEANAFAFYESTRIHPACILVKKSLADQTSRNFSVIPDRHDHFFLFTTELRQLTSIISLQDIGLYSRKSYVHLAGLTHNYIRFNAGLDPTGIDDFLVHNYYNMKVVPQQDSFLNLSKQIEAKYGKGSNTSYLHDFFKPLLY